MAEQGEAVLEKYRNQDREAPAREETPRGTPSTAPQSAPPSPEPTSRPASHVVPGTRKPNRDRIVAPSDLDDDDDQYFQDRNRGGWLQ